MSGDNTTSHAAADYEAEVQRTIPHHTDLIETAIDVALAARPGARRWLDTGCGPGTLAARVLAREPSMELTLADPSDAMLEQARLRLPSLDGARFLRTTSQDLPDGPKFDVVTAVLCHHYVDMETRARAVERCRDRLVPGGALVVFENVRSESDRGHELQRERWRRWLRDHGRDEAAITAQLAREGTKFFPVRVSQHLGSSLTSASPPSS